MLTTYINLLYPVCYGNKGTVTAVHGYVIIRKLLDSVSIVLPAFVLW
jgi:hypothetical protein